MTNNITTPYSDLNPDLILNAIESTGLRCTGSLLALNSYENRVYQIGIEDAEPIIAKFYRPHRWTDAAIIEEHHFAYELAALEIPIVAPLQLNEQTLYHYQNYRFTVFPRRGGRSMDVDNLEQLEWVGRYLGRIHRVGLAKPFYHRLQLNVNTYGLQPLQFLMNNHFVPEHIRQKFCNTTETILKLIDDMFKQLHPLQYIRLHGDCHPGNILMHSNGPHIVDLDDCLMGPAVQDIWMLLSGEHPQEIQLQLNTILNGYEQFCDFDYRQLRLIEPLRTLRLLHYAAWLAKRWDDPAFPLNFPWFNSQKYWEEQLYLFMDQLEKLNELTADF